MPSDSIVCCDFDSPLGPMIAGACDDGLCFLEWHDRGGVDRIRARVEKRYRMTLDMGKHKILKQLGSELIEYFSGKRSDFDVPLHIKGTPFERSVWNQLLKIPHGETRSYGQLAKKLKNPGASRAVGRANGANYMSILIPCHRVIDSNGKLHGYGGGLWRKKWLLELEAGVLQELVAMTL